MLLPTIPAPITTTLACVGRPLTRIPSFAFAAGSQHSEEQDATKHPRPSANPGEHLLHVRAEYPGAQSTDQCPNQPAAEAAAVSDHRDVDLGLSGRARLKPVPPLAARRPRIGFDGGHGDLARGSIPFVAVAFRGKGVAFGDVGPTGALTVDPKVCVVDPRPDLRPAIAEVGQGAEDPVPRHVGGQLKAHGWHP